MIDTEKVFTLIKCIVYSENSCSNCPLCNRCPCPVEIINGTATIDDSSCIKALQNWVKKPIDN